MSLEVRDLTAGYSNEIPILKGIDLTAEEGKVTVILGPNGAGKSTLLKTVYGYLTPNRGEILHDGRLINALEPKDMLDQGIAYLLQMHSVFPNMTVHENLRLGAWILRRDKRAMKEAFEGAYVRFPALKERRNHLAGVMSGGEQRLLELARLTMTDPKTLLLDEPSVGLMPKLVAGIYEEIAKLKDERFTILIVDQNVKKSASIADYIYVLKLGENSYHGPRADFEQRMDTIIKEWI